ncbi:unnamed protein product [Timema podura]|uniref:Uncharacterized protein n=1 Tax=Timema podura TaxID=61482 RepID=A0ABN7P0E9_TIMPD|nr:unnamed protein product [Timema podura]
MTPGYGNWTQDIWQSTPNATELSRSRPVLKVYAVATVEQQCPDPGGSLAVVRMGDRQHVERCHVMRDQPRHRRSRQIPGNSQAPLTPPGPGTMCPLLPNPLMGPLLVVNLISVARCDLLPGQAEPVNIVFTTQLNIHWSDEAFTDVLGSLDHVLLNDLQLGGPISGVPSHDARGLGKTLPCSSRTSVGTGSPQCHRAKREHRSAISYPPSTQPYLTKQTFLDLLLPGAVFKCGGGTWGADTV